MPKVPFFTRSRSWVAVSAFIIGLSVMAIRMSSRFGWVFGPTVSQRNPPSMVLSARTSKPSLSR
jgi:hypothetical protein